MPAFQRFAIQIHIQTFRRLDLHPGQARAECDALQTIDPAGQQGTQGADHILRGRNDADIQQAVIHPRLRTQQMPTASLAPIADAHGNKLALPEEIRPAEAAKGRAHLGKAGQACEKIGRAAEQALEVFGGVGGDIGAKTARGHIEEKLTIDLTQIDRLRRRIQQCQGLERSQRQPRGIGEVVGGTQRQQYQAGPGLRQRHRFGHLTQQAVATPGDQDRIAGLQRLADQPAGVTRLPGDPHIELPAILTARLHRGAHLLVAGLLAVQDQ
ncbi:hypothetical protein D3C86_1391230 [compost metagenome]